MPIAPERSRTGVAGAGSISYQRTIERGSLGCLTVCCIQKEWIPERSGLMACTACVGRASDVSIFCPNVGCVAAGGIVYLGTVNPRALPITGSPDGLRVTL